MTVALSLGRSIPDQACQLFRTAQNNDFLRRRSIEAIAAASVYAVCRLNKQPRPFEDIATVSKMSSDRIRHYYGILNRELDLPVPPVGPKRYLPQIASAVDAHAETERRGRELLERADDQVVANGQNPIGAAARALYLASWQTGEYLKQESIATATDVASVTVRKRYRDLQPVAAT